MLRLSDVRRLQELEREAEDLWPPYPERIADLEAWLERARSLVGNLDLHHETLAQMRAGAAPWTAADRAHDRRTHPLADELAASQVELQDTIADLEADIEGAELEEAERRVLELEPRIAELQDAVARRRTWRLASPEEQGQHDVLSQLVEDLEQLQSGLLADNELAAGIGWSVPRRLAFARLLEQDLAEGGASAGLWEEALPRIAAAYPGLDLRPQMGLVPLGPDPESGLWEFLHVMTGSLPSRGPDGRLVVGDESGVVLVLLRGGTFWMVRLKLQAGDGLSDARVRGGDMAFVVLLFAVSTSGLLLYLATHTRLVPYMLTFHLATVLTLFLTLPYSKFVHGFYRLAALIGNVQRAR